MRIYVKFLSIEERTSNNDDNYIKKETLHRLDNSVTWTFYEIATNKGRITLRWCGTSNGYYSESVDFVKVN